MIQLEDLYFIYEIDVIDEDQNIASIINMVPKKGEIIDEFTIPKKLGKYTITNINRYFHSFDDRNINVKKLIIPDTVKRIYNQCFRNCSILEVLVIDSSLEYLGELCFYGCNHLREVIFNRPCPSLTMHNGCFAYSPIEKIILPKKLLEIRRDVFRACDINKITIPENTRLYGSSLIGCPRLRDIYFLGDVPPNITRNSISRSKYLKLHVKSKYYENFRKLEQLKRSEKSFEIYDINTKFNEDPVGVYIDYKLDEEGNNSYEGDIVIPERIPINHTSYKVLGIEPFAFANCKNLNSVTIPKNLDIKSDEEIFIFIGSDCEIIRK